MIDKWARARCFVTKSPIILYRLEILIYHRFGGVIKKSSFAFFILMSVRSDVSIMSDPWKPPLRFNKIYTRTSLIFSTSLSNIVEIGNRTRRRRIRMSYIDRFCSWNVSVVKNISFQYFNALIYSREGSAFYGWREYRKCSSRAATILWSFLRFLTVLFITKVIK